MFKWLRKNLGFEYMHNECDYIASRLARLETTNNELKFQITIHNTALARLIAKLDPKFGISEDDPQRRKESDEIGDNVIKQLFAEEMARRHTEGKL